MYRSITRLTTASDTLISATLLLVSTSMTWRQRGSAAARRQGKFFQHQGSIKATQHALNACPGNSQQTPRSALLQHCTALHTPVPRTALHCTALPPRPHLP
jgi:hypothetical protein